VSGTSGGPVQAALQLGLEVGKRIALFPSPDDVSHSLQDLSAIFLARDVGNRRKPAQGPFRLALRQLLDEIANITHGGEMTKRRATPNAGETAPTSFSVDELHTANPHPRCAV
jgi:hypothetical protein